MTRLVTLALLFGVSISPLHGGTRQDRGETEIAALLQRLVEAQLRSDPRAAEAIYDEDLLLTSQSGKVYGKADALVDIRNLFDSYQNHALRFVHVGKDVVILNYQSTRQRRGFDKGVFRVTSVWVRKSEGWKVVSLQSTRIAPAGSG